MSALGISSETELVEEDDETPEPLPVGSVIGKYVIRRVLGAGGNGAVYEAEHTAVGHRAAIKIAHSTRKTREDIMARFQREARICGSLRHPNVGQVFDVGTLDDGSPYIVMELQDGRSLADVVDDTALPIAAIIDITRQVLAGLSAAHRSGFIHRDIKPDNVMIVRDPSGEAVVKLVDFGISKRIAAVPGDRSVTEDGVIIGSPDYMPPEQLRGDPVDARADLYAVGVLLYESITRRVPFDGKSITDLVAAVLRDPVTRPVALRPDCPVELENIVLKAMARDPVQRYQSADEMSRALAEVRANARQTTATNLARLSDRPPRPATGPRPPRRRTIDSKTLEGLRVHTGVANDATKPRSLFGMIAITAGLVLMTATLTWILATGQPTRETVVAKQLASTPATPTSEEHASVPAPSAVVLPAEPLKPSATAVPSVIPTSKPRQRPNASASVRAAAGEPVTQTTDPETTKALLKQAATAVARGQGSEARNLYRQAVKANPREADAWRGLGVAAAQIGDRAEAARAFRRYLDLRPGAEDAARVREQLGKLE